MSEDITSTCDGSVSKSEFDPRILITSDILTTALENDFGKLSSLNSFKVIDFTNPGDGYSCVVTSALCDAIIDGKPRTLSYVIKLNPRYDFKGFDELSKEFFIREGGFLVDIAPKVNEILKAIGENNLRIPTCLYANNEKDKQMLILRDLREKNFKMTNRLNCLDLKHSELTLEELARLHAAGFILKKKLSNKLLLNEYPYLVDSFLAKGHVCEESNKTFLYSCFDMAIEVLQGIEGYENCIRWLCNSKEKSLDIHRAQLRPDKDEFETLCHGDLWSNNILFRYDDKGLPEEVAFVDLQLCSSSSIATDLNYFMYSSLSGDVRKNNLESLLSSYYKMFKKVIIKDGSIDVPFTFDELKEEYEDKRYFGLFTGMFLIPMIMASNEECMDLNTITADKLDEYALNRKERNIKNLKNSPIFKLRYMAVFDFLKSETI